MNSATRRSAAALRRVVCGAVVTSLFTGGTCGAAAASATTPEQPHGHLHGNLHGHPHGQPADTEPYAVGGPWQSQRARVYGEWPAGSPDSWSRPAANSRVSAPYGIPGNWSAGHHTGIDFAVPVGTPVRSVGAGTVVSSRYSGDYGNMIIIRMKDGKYTYFAHLSKRYVRKGDRVKAGTLLGRSGNTGRTTGPHLHFEVRAKRAYGSDVDPVPYLARHGIRIR
ncbi:M23 family metallopeptidase [Streptomyces sp. N2-109]|uniref:M23 family metallopeptidase n=1 Tax=Streptomyces gossypii TaxID=2883101 RepID=A0ABT2JUZ4_9ACTN|nr:M23 family metallopeptidase [Streptomyces gossypii]MCT2591175.1 M23 family metallopeptidase [Streptomyces gossypii]